MIKFFDQIRLLACCLLFLLVLRVVPRNTGEGKIIVGACRFYLDGLKKLGDIK